MTEGTVRGMEGDAMSLCYIPEGGSVVETCTRTVQGRRLLRPGPEANDLILGVLGRAIEYAQVRVFAFTFLSSHYHLIYWADHALQMARFQNYLNSNLARELGRLHNWPEKFWGRRYRPMIVSDEKEAQKKRLKYVLGNGVYDDLVASPLSWPGPSAARALVYGEPLVGHWYNRTKEWEARRRHESYEKHDFATRYEIELEPLPAFQDLTPEAYQQEVADLVTEIEVEAGAKRAADTEKVRTVVRTVLGEKMILVQQPHHRPRKVKKSPAPKLFFADDRAERGRMREDYDVFEASYYFAANRLCERAMLSGSLNPAHEFPRGCFPRGMPFQGAQMPMPRTPPTRLIERVGEGGDLTLIRHPVPTVRVPRAAGEAGRARATMTTAGRARASPAVA